MAKKIVKKTDLKKEAQMHLKNAKTNFRNAEKQVKGYMHKHPEKSALIAAGVGAAIGAAVVAAIAASRKK